MLLAAMLGAFSGGTVTLVNQGITDPNGITAGVSFNPDGTYEGLHSTATIPFGNWLEPPIFAPGAYEIRATLLGGSASGTFDQWLALTSVRQWAVGVGGSVLILFEIGVSGAALGSCQISISA